MSFVKTDASLLLRCTDCGARLNRENSGYRCSSCGHEFPVVRGVARFVPPNNYADSFGYQWHRYSTTQLDRTGRQQSENDFAVRTGLRPADLKGKMVLDVGCGMGRFAEVATRWGANVVGIDLSNAVEKAVQNLADRDFLGLQADVFRLPFAPESFDCIYSVGVLHHTPNCEEAFSALPRLLKPGGVIAIWLYSGYNKWYRFSDQYRKITHRVSIRALHRIIRVAVPFLYGVDRGLRKIPLAGPPVAGLVNHVFPVSRNPDPETRVLDTLDWYSPRYQSKHTYEEVFRWFEKCGLESLNVGELSISVRGRRPLLSPEPSQNASSADQCLV